MKKLFDFIKSHKFFGGSCLAAAAFLIILLTTDDIIFNVLIVYILVFLTLVATRYHILLLTFDKEINFWMKQCYDYKIYRECDKGEKEFDIDIPNKIAAVNYIEYVGENFPYFIGYMDDNYYVYVITDAKLNKDDITYTTITFTKIKG